MMETSEFFNEMDSSQELAENKIEDELDKVKIYVEGDDDIPFWFAIFRKFAPELKIEFDFYSIKAAEDSDKEHEKKFKGKDFLLKKVKEDPEWVGDIKLICIDSDYDYLVSTTEYARIIRDRRPFIFQTYTYAIENYKCLAESLELICVDATYKAEQEFDFVEFLEEYSEAVYELFVYSVYAKKENPKQPIVKCSKGEIGIGDSWNINDNGKKTLEKLKEKVDKILQQIRTENNIDNQKIEQIKKELKNKGVTPQNVYLFVDAHALFDSVRPVLRKVISQLSGKHHEDIANITTGISGIDRDAVGKIHQKYNKMRLHPEALLNVNKAHFYLDCPLMDKIKNDINQYVTQHFQK